MHVLYLYHLTIFKAFFFSQDNIRKKTDTLFSITDNRPISKIKKFKGKLTSRNINAIFTQVYLHNKYDLLLAIHLLIFKVS